MSLFSGTKVETVQDGEFVGHVHVTVFRNKNGNGPFLKVNARLRAHNASLSDWLSGKYTICSISPDVSQRADVIPVGILYGGAGGLEKGLPVKKEGMCPASRW